MQTRRKFQIALIALLVAVLVSGVSAEIGWLHNASGTYSYFDTANWDGGVVSGLFSTNLTSKTTQYVQFGADFDVTAETFTLDHPGEVTFHFRGDGTGNRTATLTEDFEISPATGKGRINIGSATDGEKLNFDLGGTVRKLTTTFSPLYILNTITNGSLVVSGGGWLRLNGDGASAAGVDVTVDQATTLNFISSGSGATRTGDVTLRSGTLRATGNSAADSTEIVDSDIIVEPNPKGGVSEIYLDAAATRNAKLTAQALTRREGAILTLYDQNIGGAPGPNMANFTLATPPELVGAGGVPGSTTNSIVPWMIGGMVSNDNYDDTLVTYDPVNGFRPLSFESEFLPCTNVILGTVTAHNVLVPHTNQWEVTSNTTINSLVLGGGDKSSVPATKVSGTGKLTINSGMVLFIYNRNQTSLLSAPLDFGSQAGKFLYASGKPTTLSSHISGTGGLVFFQNRTSGTDTGLSVSGDAVNSTYTGDTFILGRVTVPSGFLPNGTRSGNVHAYGRLLMNSGTINGLFGSGQLNKPNSGGGTIQIGDNDQDGDFDGSIDDFGPLSIKKIGLGTQRLAGNCAYAGSTTVDAGTLVMDGSCSESAVTVNTGATFAGSGSFDRSGTAITLNSGATLAPGGTNGIGTMTVTQGNVVFADGAAMEVTVGKSGQGALSVEGDVTGQVTVPIAFSGEGYGKWKIIEAASIEPTFESTTPAVILSLENGGTELWAERPVPTTVILLRGSIPGSNLGQDNDTGEDDNPNDGEGDDPSADDGEPVDALFCTPDNLIANPSFETGEDWPDSWPHNTHASWETQADGSRFLRLTADVDRLTLLYKWIPLDAFAGQALELKLLGRTAITPGSDGWHDARVMMTFKDGSTPGTGSTVSPAPGTLRFPSNTQGEWQIHTLRFRVPLAARGLEIMPALPYVQSGTFDMDAISLRPIPLTEVELPAPPPLTATEQAQEAVAVLQPPPDIPAVRVVGNRLQNDAGEPVWLQGVNVPSLEWNPRGENVLSSIETAIVTWKASLIRLPVREHFWFGHGEGWASQDDGGQAYRARVDACIRKANDLGAHVILDLHRYLAPDARDVRFWNYVATRYQNQPGVLFGLFNEPHGTSWTVWRDGGEFTMDGVVMGVFGQQTLLDTVRNTGAANVVVVGGLDWAYDLSGVVRGHALTDRADGRGVVYDTHIYNWKRNWAQKVLETAEHHPVHVGEWGAQPLDNPFDFIPAADQEDPATWMPDIIGMIQHHQLSHTAWCLHPSAAPSLIQNWQYDPTPHFGDYVLRMLDGEIFTLDRYR